MTEAELQKLDQAELARRLHETTQQVFEAESALSACYRESARRRGKLDVIEENERKNAYDFEMVKWRIEKVIARVIEDGLAEEIPVDVHIAAESLLKQYGGGAAALAVVLTAISRMALRGGHKHFPPFRYAGEKERRCH